MLQLSGFYWNSRSIIKLWLKANNTFIFLRFLSKKYKNISSLTFYWLKSIILFLIHSSRAVVFKLCAAALWGAVRNLKGAANFFRQDEILQFFYRSLLGCAAKFFWCLSGCREPKCLKTTALGDLQNLVGFVHISCSS
jgi:hypothetical protein